MQGLLRRLGILKPEKSETTPPVRSFLSCNISSGQIDCNWKLRDETKKLVSKSYDSTLILRLKSIATGDSSRGMTAVIEAETSIWKEAATINMPTESGKLMLELGYRDADGVFITLEFSLIDLGPIVVPMPQDQDWFAVKEMPSLHQRMYELASKNLSIGGSETFQDLRG